MRRSSANSASQSRTSRIRERAHRARARPADRIGRAAARRDDGETGFVGDVVADENRRAAEERRRGEKPSIAPPLSRPGRLHLDRAMRVQDFDGIRGGLDQAHDGLAQRPPRCAAGNGR